MNPTAQRTIFPCSLLLLIPAWLCLLLQLAALADQTNRSAPQWGFSPLAAKDVVASRGKRNLRPQAQAANAGPDQRRSSQTSRQDKSAKTADNQRPRYTTRKIHDPHGIGKFYMGREIARVMGYPAAGWLERRQREEEEKLSTLVKSLELKPGMIVADIGAGSGVISLMMADKAGPEGRIVAVDIQQEMLDLLAKKLKQQEVDNVELVLGTDKSPRLPPASIDLALLVDVYHEFRFPYEMTLHISKAMRPGGRVVLVEYRREDPKVPIKRVHTMTEAQIKREIGQPEFGLQWKKTIEVLPWQRIVIFERRDPSPQATREGFRFSEMTCSFKTHLGGRVRPKGWPGSAEGR